MLNKGSKYREEVSQMVSWGHWFTLFNIFASLIIGSRYLFIIDWPSSLMGRIYSLISWLGHLSFIVFATYLLFIFPLTFLIRSQRLLRFITATLASVGLTLLLVDAEIFRHLHLHLNRLVLGLLLTPAWGELSRNWQWLFAVLPLLFLVEMLFGTWCWQKLRSLNRFRFTKLIALFLITCFIGSHLLYIWADANFYRPITMQKTNLPLSHPMTARRFLEKHGIINAVEYQQRLLEQGNPAATTVEYPLSNISFYDAGSRLNLLLVVVDGIRTQDLARDMPNLFQFSQQNINFTQHMSSGNTDTTGLFGLFYGISPTYLDGILAGRKPSVLTSSLTQQSYQMGLFSSDGFKDSLYRQALFTDISLPQPALQSNLETTQQWQQWLQQTTSNTPWFAYINYQSQLANADETQSSKFTDDYRAGAKRVDQQIKNLLVTLEEKNQLDNTVVVITAKHGVEFNDSATNSWGAGQNYSRTQLHVPLAIHWPKTPTQLVSKLTSHEDLMLTLMQRLLHVNTPAASYSQGEDLFSPERKNNWVLLGDAKQLVIFTTEQTITLDEYGNYNLYNLRYEKQPKNQLKLPLILQALTENKRFVAD